MDARMQELEALYRKYGHLLERRCRRLLGAAEARDAAHEAFARAVGKLESFRGEGERLAWLYRISTNVCLNLLRDRRRRGAAWVDEVGRALEASSDGEHAAAARQAALRALEAVDDELTRRLVIHVYIDEMTQGEAADLAGVSRATANQRLASFRERARAVLGGVS
jgi:RNA polymerase sigma-70 factor (ECF subfamily)